MAEALAGVAYNQLVRAGAPVIMGAFVTSIDMNSGAPTFGTPEASKILYTEQGSWRGDWVCRFGLVAGCAGLNYLTHRRLMRARIRLNATLLGGVNFCLHSAGWLEGGLVSSPEKLVMDADQLGALHSLASGVDVSEDAQALDAIEEVGPGGHYLGCAHTQRNFQSAFWRSNVLDYRPYETWAEDGEKDCFTLGA